MNKKKSKKLTLSFETLKNLNHQVAGEATGPCTGRCTALCTATHGCSDCVPCA